MLRRVKRWMGCRLGIHDYGVIGVFVEGHFQRAYQQCHWCGRKKDRPMYVRDR